MKNFIILGTVLTLLMVMVSPVMAEVGSWEVGFGVPYGIIGVNLGYKIIPNLDLSLGLGISPLSGFAYNIGGKLFFASQEKSFRPMVSCYYGTNTMVETPHTYGPGEYINYNGVTVGVGASVTFDQAHRNGLIFQVLHKVSTESNINQLKVEGYKTSGIDDTSFSLGYLHRF